MADAPRRVVNQSIVGDGLWPDKRRGLRRAWGPRSRPAGSAQVTFGETGELNRTLARTNTSRERQAAEQHFKSVAPRYDCLRDTDHDAVALIRARLPNRPLVGADVGAGTGR